MAGWLKKSRLGLNLMKMEVMWLEGEALGLESKLPSLDRSFLLIPGRSVRMVKEIYLADQPVHENAIGAESGSYNFSFNSSILYQVLFGF